MIQASSSHSDKVVLRYPGIPVVVQDGQRRGVVLRLAKRKFVHDRSVSSILEDARCDPRLS
jgi:hypothetical protein